MVFLKKKKVEVLPPGRQKVPAFTSAAS